MSVADALDTMRAEVSGCRMVLYADLKSRLVLSASSAGNPGQEELDALSGAAQIALDGILGEGAKAVWNSDADAATAFLLTGSDARIFVRALGGAPEALVCLCTADVDLSAVLDSGHRTLAAIQAASA